MASGRMRKSAKEFKIDTIAPEDAVIVKSDQVDYDGAYNGELPQEVAR